MWYDCEIILTLTISCFPRKGQIYDTTVIRLAKGSVDFYHIEVQIHFQNYSLTYFSAISIDFELDDLNFNLMIFN